MNTKIVSLNEDTIRFLVDGVNAAFANSLRRTMVAEVPIMTVEDIFYFDNSSIVPDEVLAHRIGFVPLTTDLDNYVLPEECDCEAELGCPKCRAGLTMDIEAKDDTVTVYSGDIVPENPSIAPVSKRIPLAKLAPGQAIKFEAYAQLGQGKVHAKWSPVSMCVYQNVALVDVEDEAATKECLDACGDDVAVIEGDVLKVIDIQGFERGRRCRELVSHEEIIGGLKKDEFLFTVESTGGLPPERIVKEAVKMLKQKLSTLRGKIEADDLHDEIRDFDLPEINEGKLYSVGSGDFDEDEGGNEKPQGDDVA
ncbi:DNA-directed RNA polymerase subunit D [Candidatus Bathyarchaeota archaeon]|nr:DNA-directed RNA polymerase subunit D [Candidatus Bathyarchaeota archaeon]